MSIVEVRDESHVDFAHEKRHKRWWCRKARGEGGGKVLINFGFMQILLRR